MCATTYQPDYSERRAKIEYDHILGMLESPTGRTLLWDWWQRNKVVPELPSMPSSSMGSTTTTPPRPELVTLAQLEHVVPGFKKGTMKNRLSKPKQTSVPTPRPTIASQGSGENMYPYQPLRAFIIAEFPRLDALYPATFAEFLTRQSVA